ncbi:hypothetical protein LZ30DRAFT_59527 [Colletotrichum cereale]|nr:hypothetical protein LZ30DRAFT_59527 [Colletotrichum cereale]
MSSFFPHVLLSFLIPMRPLPVSVLFSHTHTHTHTLTSLQPSGASAFLGEKQNKWGRMRWLGTTILAPPESPPRTSRQVPPQFSQLHSAGRGPTHYLGTGTRETGPASVSSSSSKTAFGPIPLWAIIAPIPEPRGAAGSRTLQIIGRVGTTSPSPLLFPPSPLR